MAPIDLPPLINPPAGYERRVSGVLAPARQIERLQRGSLPGFGAAPGLIARPTRKSASVTATGSSSAGLSTYTFAGQSLGPEHPSRIIVVAAVQAAGATRTLSSGSIAGVSVLTALAITKGGNTVNPTVGLYYASVPTGLTGDIVLSFSAGCSSCDIAVFSLLAFSSATPVATKNGGTNSGTQDLSVNTLDDGVVIGVSGNGAGAVGWTNLTEIFDSTHDSMGHAVAWTPTLVGAATPYVCNVTGQSANARSLSASWS
mgnify:CR=1 FL=1